VRFGYAASAVFLVLCFLVGCGSKSGARPRVTAADTPLWGEADRQAVVAYWGKEGRYLVGSAGLPERMNVTVAGSTWYADYTRQLAQQTPAVQAEWQGWVNARVAAEKSAMEASLRNATPNEPTVPAGSKMPDSLRAAVGEPPLLYEKTRPLKYTVTFDRADAPEPFIYIDSVPFADRKAYYPYLRSANGVMKVGKRVRDYQGKEREKLDALFASVGRTASEGKVLLAVSALEGGFEAINTYDTGFVSIGLIQFITAKDGSGSLGAVLARYKADDFAGFRDDFHRFGIDVTPEARVAVVDPATGVEKRGEEAVRAIIDDKRLTATFERAGLRDGFRRAQVIVARERYWPGEDTVTVQIGGVTQSARVSEIVRSEAGLATLMDRKVNRGNIRLINEVAAQLVARHQLTAVTDLAKHERELVQAMKFRADFLADPTLTQPESAGVAGKVAK
jgi:hypothetical protein